MNKADGQVAGAAGRGVPRGYKQTEVGVIPEDWNVSTVGHEFNIKLGKMLDAEKNVGVPKPFLGNSSVQWGHIDVSDLGEIRLSPTDLQRFRLKGGDLLVCEGGDVGRAAIWREQLDECYYQKALHRLRPKRGYSIELMCNLLEKMSASGLLQNYVTQTSIAHLPKDKFETVPIPVPSTKAEQNAIAEALSDADALIESLAQLLAKKRDLKQGAMQELLTGKRRLPGQFGPWVERRLSELGSTYGGLTGKSKADFGTGSAEYVTFMNVMSNVVLDRQLFEPVNVKPTESQNRVAKGDLFFNGSSETPDELALCSLLADEVRNVFLNSFCFGFRLRDGSDADGLFLTYFFRSEQGRELFKSLAQGATRYNLSKSAFLDVLTCLPQKEEQVAISKVLSDIDTEIKSLESKLTKARRLKQGMMQALLTGRIRLI